jgi:hypothetical protein
MCLFLRQLFETDIVSNSEHVSCLNEIFMAIVPKIMTAVTALDFELMLAK